MRHPDLLNLATLVPVLNKYHLLTQDENNFLLNRMTIPTEKASTLVYIILPSKGPEAFSLFLRCLQEEKEHLGHQTLAKKLTVSKKCKLFFTIDYSGIVRVKAVLLHTYIFLEP